MIYVVVHELNKVIAWTNKCGGSSVRRQLLIDLDNQSFFDEMDRENKTEWEIVTENFDLNVDPKQIPKYYNFEWYVRDPFYMLLSCFLNRQVIKENNAPELNFIDFIMNLDYYRSQSLNIRSHSDHQTLDYFEAPWKIIDINLAEFTSFNKKMNDTKYTLGDKEDAWGIPSKNLFLNKSTYSPISFYSGEIIKELKRFYSKDYMVLQDKIKLI